MNPPLLLRPLAIGRVRLLWGALTLSAIGDQLYAVALVWVAVTVFGAAAGYLSALQAGCGLVAALLAGRWADQWEQRRAMAGADLVRATVLLGLVAWWLANNGPPPTGLAVAILVLAAGEAVFRPALAATPPCPAARPRAAAPSQRPVRHHGTLGPAAGPGAGRPVGGGSPRGSLLHPGCRDLPAFGIRDPRPGPGRPAHAPSPHLPPGWDRSRLLRCARSPAAMDGAAGQRSDQWACGSPRSPWRCRC